jgi:hypothetical protein
MTDIETLLRNTDLSEKHGQSVAKTALLNAMLVGSYNMTGRTRITSADLRLFDATWELWKRHFSGPDLAETGDHIPPQTEEQPTEMVTALEDLTTREY